MSVCRPCLPALSVFVCLCLSFLLPLRGLIFFCRKSEKTYISYPKSVDIWGKI